MKRLIALLLAALLIAGCGDREDHAQDEHGHDEHGTGEDFERGPHGGRLLEHEGFAVEIGIEESGVPPEFRIWLFDDGKPLPPTAANIEVKTTRLDGTATTFRFRPENDYLRADGTVVEPHSFDVVVKAMRPNDEPRDWTYESYEGRTRIAVATAESMGVKVATAGPGVLKEELTLAGTVQADPTRISRVRARYPGIVREVAVEPLSVVARGAVLAQIQSNESLQNYALTAPIAGTIVEHRAQIGEATGDEPLFTIIDVTKVWVELDVFQGELGRIEAQQSVALLDLDGKQAATGRIGRLAPLAAHGSQSVRARVVIDNASGALRPGQFVSARVTVGETRAPLVVELTALQRFRDFDVVFERIDDTYEVRMLELGRRDARYIEVLDGLKPGAQYVAANSFLIKADIEKSGASHDH
jgi:cobalt-zinc-cadmium efflux system membrane fusion protein